MKAWWTAVHAPEPTATSPLSRASPVGSNSGASTIHVNAHALSSISSRRAASSPRSAPSSARERLTGPAAKKMQSPAAAPVWAARPARSASDRFFATGPRSSPSVPDEHVREALRAALPGPLLPLVEHAARLLGAARHHDRADVRRLEDRELAAREVVGALHELEAEAQVGLVRAEAAHRLRIRHARQRRLQLDADRAPHRAEHVLAERDHVVLLDEAHLDVELGELRLAVRAEVLVAVAARDLEVALEAADHQQLLEQLRALRQRVERTRLQARRHEEVARALRGRARQRRRLDLDEVALQKRRAHRRRDLRAQLQRLRRSVPAQVEIAVGEPDLLARLVVERERQHVARREHGQARRLDLDLARGDRLVDVALGALAHDPRDRHARLHAQRLRGRDLLVVEGHLRDARGVAQVDEGDAAVVADARDPAGQRDLLGHVRAAECGGVVGSVHRASMGRERSLAGAGAGRRQDRCGV